MTELNTQEKSREEAIQEYLSNQNCFKWLFEYSKENIVIFSDDPVNDTESNNIKSMVRLKLGFIYNLISNYANNKGIYSQQCNYSIYYKLKIEDIGFDIGIIKFGSAVTFFCNKEEITNPEAYIDYKDVLDYYQKENISRKK